MKVDLDVEGVNMNSMSTIAEEKKAWKIIDGDMKQRKILAALKKFYHNSSISMELGAHGIFRLYIDQKLIQVYEHLFMERLYH
jgi:hypothetical protein